MKVQFEITEKYIDDAQRSERHVVAVCFVLPSGDHDVVVGQLMPTTAVDLRKRMLASADHST